MKSTNHGIASALNDLPVREAEAVAGGTTTTDGCASSTRPKATTTPPVDPPSGPHVIISVISVLVG
jgi:hypothetical protein